MDFRYDSFCGLYCGACETLRANMEDRIDELARQRERTVEDVTCFGCKTEINGSYCRRCVIKQCAKDKEIEFCSDCLEYPCQRLRDFCDDKYPHHSIVTKNLEYLKRHGEVSWLNEQKIRWSCSKCGANFSWYSDRCKNCGEKVHNCRDEEATLAQGGKTCDSDTPKT